LSVSSSTSGVAVILELEEVVVPSPPLPMKVVLMVILPALVLPATQP
jgi:hypothetical protein